MTTPETDRRRPTLGTVVDTIVDTGPEPDDVHALESPGAATDDALLPSSTTRDRRAAPKSPVDPVLRRRVRVSAATAVLALVAFLAVSGFEAHAQLGRSSQVFTATRAQERATLARLAWTEAHLASLLEHSASTHRTLGTVSGQLTAERDQLAQQQKDLFVQGVSISALDQCLGGVEAALNQVAVNDQSGAASTLQGVASSCQTAGASGG